MVWEEDSVTGVSFNAGITPLTTKSRLVHHTSLATHSPEYTVDPSQLYTP